MLLTSMLISSACANINVYANHQDACNKFMEVSSQKIGLEQTDQKIENYYTLEAKTTATNNLGPAAIDVAAVGAYSYKVYRNKAIDFKLPNMGICDTLSNHVTPNSYSVNMGWKI